MMEGKALTPWLKCVDFVLFPLFFLCIFQALKKDRVLLIIK